MGRRDRRRFKLRPAASLLIAAAAVSGIAVGCRADPTARMSRGGRAPDTDTPARLERSLRSPYGSSPRAFLAALVRTPSDYVTVEEAPATWLNKESVKPLMEKLRSTTPCAAVIHEYSSRSVYHRSTEGREALFMIEGYLIGSYPPAGLGADRIDACSSRGTRPACHNE